VRRRRPGPGRRLRARRCARLSADPRAEGGEAVSFYTERFRKAFRDAGEAVGAAGDQLADWLRRGGDDDTA
jgi:hypothetical protein